LPLLRNSQRDAFITRKVSIRYVFNNLARKNSKEFRVPPSLPIREINVQPGVTRNHVLDKMAAQTPPRLSALSRGSLHAGGLQPADTAGKGHAGLACAMHERDNVWRADMRRQENMKATR
jgi:hypothetical protein